MNNDSADSSPVQSDAAATARPEDLAKLAEGHLATLITFLKQAETAAAAATENQRLSAVALTEAQAKLDAANTLATAVTNAATAATETQRVAKSVLTEVQAKLTATTTIATSVAATGAKIDADAAVIDTQAKHIDAAQSHADGVRAALDTASTKATQSATAAEGLQQRAQTAADTAATLLQDVQTAKTTTATDAAAIAEALKASKAHALQTKSLADKATTVEEAIAAYEKKLVELEEQTNEKLKTVERLLPGATSAGLAHEFNARSESFRAPRVRWQGIFMTALTLLIVLGLSGLIHVIWTGTALTYDELLRLWLSRLPIAASLLWLALHASRESALARRLEEDYGYKSAIAASFEGFHKQMKDIGDSAEDNGPLKQLCENTLATIATPPGRIYERHELTVSPSAEAVAITTSLLNMAKHQSLFLLADLQSAVDTETITPLASASCRPELSQGGRGELRNTCPIHTPKKISEIDFRYQPV